MAQQQSVIDIILAAKNASSAVFDQAMKDLKGVGDAGKEAQDGLDQASEGAEGAGQAFGGAGSEAKQTAAILDELKGLLKPIANGLDNTSKALDEMAKSGKKGGEGVKSSLLNLSNLISVGGAVVGVLGSVKDAFVESLERSAERGNQQVLVLFGAFGKLQDAMDKVIGAVVQGLVPALVPLVSGLADVAAGTAQWIADSGVVQTAVDLTMSILIALLRVLDKSAQGWRMLADIMRYAFGRAVSAVKSSLAGLIGVMAEAVIGAGAIAQAVGNQGTANEMFVLARSLQDTSKAWRKASKDTKDAELVIREGQTAIGDAADALERYIGTIDRTGQAYKDATVDQLLFSEKGRERLELMMQAQLEAVGENREARLAVFEKFQRLEEAAQRKGGNRWLELEAEIQALVTETRAIETEARLQSELQMAGDNAQLQLEVWRKYHDQLKEIFGESSAEFIESQTEQALLEQEIHMGRAELLKELWTGVKDWFTQFHEERLEEELAAIESQRELGAQESEIVAAKIEAWETFAQKFEEGSKRRIEAEKQVTALQKQQAKIQLQTAQQTAQKRWAIESSFTAVLVSATGTMKERVTAITKAMSDDVVGMFESQATQAVQYATQQAAGVKAASLTELSASLGPLGAIVAKAHAAIPWPAGPALAALALAAFRSLAQKTLGGLKFNRGGLIPGRGGEIPGTGFIDSVPVDATGGEYMVRSESARAIGRRNLDFMNETGRLPPGAAAAAAGPQEINLNLTIRMAGGVLFPNQVIDEVIPPLLDAINRNVTTKGGKLVASHVAKTQRKL